MPTFLATALSLYALANLYVFIRGWTVLPRKFLVRLLYVFFSLLLMSGYVLARAGRQFIPAPVISGLSWIGSWWVGVVLYLLLFALLADAIRFLNRLLHFLPPGTKEIRLRQRRMVAAGIAAATLALLAYGGYNASVPRVVAVPLRIAKPCGDVKKLTIAFVSDLHLGRMVGKDFLRAVIGRVSALRPDLVILGGDILDVEIGEEEERALVETLSGLKPPLGLYAILGNHEYICGAEHSAALLEKAGATLLRDTVARPVPDLYFAGRDGYSRRWKLSERKPLSEILSGRDKRCPLIVLDHQPTKVVVAEARRAEADLMICGHTHAGQLFPWNWAIRIFYDKIYGLFQEGKTAVFVSSGVGTWGPPARVGNRPEVVLLEITFNSGR